MLTIADQVGEAGELLSAVIAGAHRRGSVIDFAHGCTMRAELEFRAGRLDAAESDARQALEISREHGLWLIVLALAWLVEVLVDGSPPHQSLRLIA